MLFVGRQNLTALPGALYCEGPHYDGGHFVSKEYICFQRCLFVSSSRHCRQIHDPLANGNTNLWLVFFNFTHRVGTWVETAQHRPHYEFSRISHCVAACLWCTFIFVCNKCVVFLVLAVPCHVAVTAPLFTLLITPIIEKVQFCVKIEFNKCNKNKIAAKQVGDWTIIQSSTEHEVRGKVPRAKQTAAIK